MHSLIVRHKLNDLNYSIRVVGGQNSTQKDIAVFFVHGAPGSSQDFYRYLQDTLLIKKANLYSIDRPGYGYSNFGKSETSIEKQSKIVAKIIDRLPEQKFIVVGHSFGGPIAALASLETKKIKEVIMLAPAIDPDNEKILKIALLGKWKATKWMLPKALRVSSDEKFTHVKELEKIKPNWSKIKVPVIHYHGTKDILVPYENLRFSELHFDKNHFTPITLEKENHFLPWKQYELIKNQLIEIINAQS